MDSEEDTGGVFMGTLSYPELEATIRLLLKKYHAEYALLFGSYARGEALESKILRSFSGSNSMRSSVTELEKVKLIVFLFAISVNE